MITEHSVGGVINCNDWKGIWHAPSWWVFTALKIIKALYGKLLIWQKGRRWCQKRLLLKLKF